MTAPVAETNSISGGKEEESDEESDIVEESPCGRWQKRKEQVNQGNVPGIESASLGMDTDDGVEVVWNEVLFSDRKVFDALEDKIKRMFGNLMQIEHPNIVKFHKYWLDMQENQVRVIFITEYMSSGSLKQFLKKTKKNDKTMNVKAWKRWCTQILSALNYLHSYDPPIIHGNLTCDTIFIQHNGLLKIGAVWHRLFVNVFPEASETDSHYQDDQRNMHFFCPEYALGEDSYAIDVFSFGICALEVCDSPMVTAASFLVFLSGAVYIAADVAKQMWVLQMAVLEIQSKVDSEVSQEDITQAWQSLEDPLMREFTQSCVQHEASLRPTAHDLLFHSVLFEVHSLKLLAAHCLINNQYHFPENCVEDKAKSFDPTVVMAEIEHKDRPGVQLKYSNVSHLELHKFLEDIKSGIYPLTNIASAYPHPIPHFLSLTQESVERVRSPTPEPQEKETRKVVQMHCNLESNEEGTKTHLSLLLKMDDNLHRQLNCDIQPSDNPKDLVNELVHFALLSEEDSEKLTGFLEDALCKHRLSIPRCVGGDAPIGPQGTLV